MERAVETPKVRLAREASNRFCENALVPNSNAMPYTTIFFNTPYFLNYLLGLELGLLIEPPPPLGREEGIDEGREEGDDIRLLFEGRELGTPRS